MTLHLLRLTSNQSNTLSLLYIDGDFFAFVPEDAYHETKVPGETRIPVGKYRVDLTYSPRFNRNMWEVLQVPGYSGVRFHTGNSSDDTEGCIMPGLGVDLQFNGRYVASRSREAMGQLDSRLQSAKDADEQIWLTVSDELLERPLL
jgi:hypothetical protein